MKKLFAFAAMMFLFAAVSCDEQTIDPKETPVESSEVGYIQMEFIYLDGTTEKTNIISVQ